MLAQPQRARIRLRAHHYIQRAFNDMQGNEIREGARHRILILTCIACLTLSLAPTIVAPPERGFAQGQPEMQQAMDNMVTHGTIVKKRMGILSYDGSDYQTMLTSKTSNLLAEAESVLRSLPVSKERQWIEAFVHRMKAIATMLEKTAQNEEQNLPKILISVSGTPVPEGLPLQSTWPATSAVPGIIPFQKQSRMMSKLPVTSPELSQVLPANEYPKEHQAVTKPAELSSNKEENDDDELVRELENLHQEFVQPVPQQNSKMFDQLPTFTTPSTASSEIHGDKLPTMIAEFHRLGGVIPSEVINALYADNQKVSGSTTNPKPEIEDKLKFTEAGMVDTPAIQGLNDFNSEEKEISNTNLQNIGLEKDLPYQVEKQIQQANFNHSFQNIHANFHPNLQALPKGVGNNFHYMSLQSKEPYQGLQNAIHNLQKPNPYHNQQAGHIPDTVKQMLSKPQNKIYNDASNYNEYLMRHSYGPYSHVHNWNHKNSTHHLPLMMPPYQTKLTMNHHIDTLLNDEMKRQLRDGKIIMLSDSVVRSNFEPKKDAKNAENKSDKPMPENVENKNDTITSN